MCGVYLHTCKNSVFFFFEVFYMKTVQFNFILTSNNTNLLILESLSVTVNIGTGMSFGGNTAHFYKFYSSWLPKMYVKGLIWRDMNGETEDLLQAYVQRFEKCPLQGLLDRILLLMKPWVLHAYSYPFSSQVSK